MSEVIKEHPLEEYSEEEQISYLSILSAICYVDKEFSDQEKQQLDKLLKTLKISDEGKGKIYSAIFSLQAEEKLEDLALIENLNDTELKYTLISDLCLFAFSDSEFTENEYQYVLEVGKILGITQEQINAIKFVQENVGKIKDIPPGSEKAKRILKDSVAKLAGVGVPIGAIAVTGSVTGLSATGITSGLATLGAVVGGGMLAGAVIVVPAIAAGSIFGVKKLLDIVWKDKDVIDEPSEKKLNPQERIKQWINRKKS